MSTNNLVHECLNQCIEAGTLESKLFESTTFGVYDDLHESDTDQRRSCVTVALTEE